MPIDYGAPTGSPEAFNCDEIIPVALGGSPYDKANVEAAHACCNNWRATKPASEVSATRAAVASTFGGWASPSDFVAKAKALRKGGKAGASAMSRASKLAPGSASKTTTDWL